MVSKDTIWILLYLDTLQNIRRCGNRKPNEYQVKDYMELATHIVALLKEM